MLRNKACPRCNEDVVNYGPERISTAAFIDNISPKLIELDFLEQMAARNILTDISKMLEDEHFRAKLQTE